MRTYAWRLVAAAAVGAVLAGVTSYTGVSHISLTGSKVISVSWIRQAPAHGEIAPATSADTKVVRHQSAAGPAARTPSRLTNSPSSATTFEWLSGQVTGQNFSYPDGATGMLQNVQNALGGTLLDVQVAAGHTHVCVTARAALACYNKAGELVSLGHGIGPQVESAKTFFTQAGISVLPAFDGSQNQIKDGRIIFDQHTDRFYMFFQERGQTARLLIAASRSEDPSDGWYAWADDETQYNAPNGTLNGQDYDYIGLNANYLLASSDMEPCALDSTNTWTCNRNKRTLVHFIYNLSELSAGQLNTRGSWYDSSGQNIWAAPVADQGSDVNAYWVARTGNQTAVIYQLNPQGYINSATAALPNASNPYSGTTSMSPANEPAGGIVDYGIVGNGYRNAAKLGNFITAASDDGFSWPGQPTSSNAVRLDIFNITGTVFNNSSTPGVSVLRDRIFGLSSAGDPAGSVFDYGDPGVAFTSSGDIGVGELRSNPATYPQLRGSVWFGGQSDISPSLALFTGSGPLYSIHMSGASVDPSSANGMYFAQVVGEAPSVTCRDSSSPCGALIGVAKVDGTLQPDLIATNLSGPARLLPMQTAQDWVTILNQGDGPAPATSGRLYLNSTGTGLINTLNDQSVAQFAIPALSAGQSVTIPVSYQTPNIACQCVVGAFITPVPNENSSNNNLNPYLDGLHGNISMVLNPITNGDFRTGDLSGWSAAGTAAAVPEGSSTWGARLGTTSATSGDSTITQTFTAPVNTSTLSFDYQNNCQDHVQYDWATATLTDNTTQVTTRILPDTCTTTPNWTYVGTPIYGGHSYTLTLFNHDDGYVADPTYTDYSNVAVS